MWEGECGEGECGEGDCGEGECGEGKWIPFVIRPVELTMMGGNIHFDSTTKQCMYKYNQTQRVN